MTKGIKKLLTIGTVMLTLAGSVVPVGARNIGTFENFTVTYSGDEAYTGFLTKTSDQGNAVVNLSNDTGTAWITVNMRNSEDAYRGGCTLQRGTRKVFSTTGSAGYYYRLGMRKTNNTGGGSVTIKGSWSPDES